MNIEIWLWLSIAAMTASIAKVFIVKKLCSDIDSRVLVFVSRLSAAVLLLAVAKYNNLSIPKDLIFWKTVIFTAVFTAIASVMFTKSIQKGNLPIVIPIQSLVPVFSILTLFIVYKETIKPISFLFIILSAAATALALYYNTAAKKDNKPAIDKMAIYSLAAAAIFGVCTIFDRTAIARVANGALLYSAYWNLTSAAIILLECIRLSKLKKLISKSVLLYAGIYSLTNLAAFYFQQAAVEESLAIEGAVVNVKAIVMVYLSMVVVIDWTISKTKANLKAVIFGLAAIIFAILLVLSLGFSA